MKKLNAVMLVAASVGLLGVTGCETETGDGPADSASIRSALSGDMHDVSGFFYDIQCDDGFGYTEYVPLETEPAPIWILEDGAGEEHYFSDLFVVLPPGECEVVATPMQDETTPSEECAPVDDEFEVVAEWTTEIVLMSQCEGDPNGAADIAAGLNDPPIIQDLELDPSKFICLDEEVEVTVFAEDPNGDAIDFTWEIHSWPEQPASGDFEILVLDEDSMAFDAGTPGPYQVTVTATDVYGASTSLTFPIHVSDCSDTFFATSGTALYLIDLGPAVPTATLIGPHGVSEMTDIAEAPDGSLFGNSHGKFYTVDTGTGAVSYVGTTNENFIGMCVTPDAVVFGSNGDLWEIDPVTAGITHIGAIGAYTAGDLACPDAATMYMSSTTNELLSVDPNTGAGTVIGPIGFSGVWGLHWTGVELLGLTSYGELIEIDPTTGAGTLIHDFDVAWWGAS